MNHKPKNRLRAAVALLLLAMALLAPGHRASAVCATVKIQINQDMAFERQAFEAQMTINNALPDAVLTDFKAQGHGVSHYVFILEAIK